jgi:hypothetical protein
MKYLVASLVVCLAAVGVYAQQNPPTEQRKPAEVEVTGCVVQGSSPSVQILQNARQDPKDPTEKGLKFLLMPASADLSIKGHLNHEVRVIGVSDGRPAPTMDQKVEEKDLPVLQVKTLVMIAPTCAAAR